MRKLSGIVVAVAVLCATQVPHAAAGPGEVGRPAEIPLFDDTGVQANAAMEGLALQTVDGERFPLSDAWKDQPALIVLSSISCPVSRDNCQPVEQIGQRYAGKVKVVVIYTIDAHPVGAPSPYSDREWLTDRNIADNIRIQQPGTLAERTEMAKRYQTDHKLRSTLLVDSMDNAAWKQIGPGPNTAILVDTTGRVVMRQGWLEPAGMETAVRAHLTVRSKQPDRKTLQAVEKKYGVELFDESPRNKRTDDERQRLDKLLKDLPEMVNAVSGGSRFAAEGASMLHQAVDRGDQAQIDFLIAHKADVNQLDPRGQTPLHAAARGKDVGIARKLLDAGADASSADSLGLTPLHLALIENNAEITKLLVARGAFVDIRAAAGLGDIDAAKKYIDLYRATELYLKRRGGMALAFAAAAGQTPVVKYLLDEKVKKDELILKKNAVHLAVANKQHEALAALLQAGASTKTNIDLFGNPGTLLHVAAQQNDVESIRLLIAQGMSVEAFDVDEETPLHWATIFGSIDAMKALLKAGANVDARSGLMAPRPCGSGEEGKAPELQTPLHLAVRRTNPEAVRVLLEAGASRTLKNRSGLTAVQLAREQANEENAKPDNAGILKLLEAPQ